MRYRITLSYDGSPFCGWQIQPNAPSVQGALEAALETLLKCRTAVTGAGRTDTEVNARGYVAHFDASEPLDCRQLRYKLNAILPEAVSVEALEAAEDDFHARFDATRREYKYFLHRVKDPFIGRYSYEYGYPDLNIDTMNKAAEALIGTHDFSCFEKTGGNNKTSICTVFTAQWADYQPVMAATDEPGSYLCFTMAADRFLRNMVRATVGTLLEVGRGKRTAEEFASLILEPSVGTDGMVKAMGGHTPSQCGTDSQAPGPCGTSAATPRRTLAGESAPGHALFLTKIEY